MRGAIPPHPKYVFMAWCLVKHKGFTIYKRVNKTAVLPKNFKEILIFQLRVWYYKVKGKVFPVLAEHHAMKAYWGNGSIAPRILDLGT
jgi:hypothetical protein